MSANADARFPLVLGRYFMDMQEAMEILEVGKRGDVVNDVQTSKGLVRIRRGKRGFEIKVNDAPPVIRDILKDRREQGKLGIGS